MPVDLSFADKSYDTTEAAPEGGGGRRCIADGTYQVWVQSAEITETGYKGKHLEFPVLKILFRELDDSNGPAPMTQQIHPDVKRMAFLKRLIMQLWPSPAPRPSEMEGRLDEILSRCYEIAVKTTAKGDKSYTNVYVQRFLNGVSPPEVDQYGERLPF